MLQPSCKRKKPSLKACRLLRESDEVLEAILRSNIDARNNSGTASQAASGSWRVSQVIRLWSQSAGKWGDRTWSDLRSYADGDPGDFSRSSISGSRCFPVRLASSFRT